MSLHILKFADGKEIIRRYYPIGLGPVYELFKEFGWNEVRNDDRAQNIGNTWPVSQYADDDDAITNPGSLCIDEYVFTKECGRKMREFRIRLFQKDIEVIVPIFSKDYSYSTRFTSYYDMTDYIEHHLKYQDETYDQQKSNNVLFDKEKSKEVHSD